MNYEMPKKSSDDKSRVPTGLQEWAKNRGLKIIDVVQPVGDSGSIQVKEE